MGKVLKTGNILRRRIISPLKEFIHDSRAVGITLICCTIISLIVSNSAWAEPYINFWELEAHIPTPHLHLPHTILHIINDGLMALFFLLVGMEIKRELLIGELSSVKKSMLPIVGAIGGMVVPATICYIWCGNTPYSGGWGVPMATDIAFSLGVLSLLGKRAPLSLKIFLTALAIIDDLGAILAIAIFYTSSLNLMYLGLGGVVLLALIMLNLFKVHRSYIYFILGAVLWYFIFNSGIHATIAGVLLAFTIPLKHIHKLETKLHDPVNFIILPLFALANTAIMLPSDFTSIYNSKVHHGIFMGLVVGKPLGIFLLCFLAVKLRIASLPGNLSWKQIFGLGLVAGIGFTMSIFIATLAFGEVEVQLISKVAIIGASLVSGIVGFTYLKMLPTPVVVAPDEQYAMHEE